MGSTPIYNIPFADPTDLVRDWPALSEDVALAIEAALEDISVPQKRIEAFTGSGTWTVPAGVTYAIAHMMGGGGGIGRDSSGTDGTASSVAFAAGTVTAPGQARTFMLDVTASGARAGADNLGQSATMGAGDSTGRVLGAAGPSAPFIVAGGVVTPAASITVTVGAGGAAGTNGAAGGSGYVYIEYYEEV